MEQGIAPSCEDVLKRLDPVSHINCSITLGVTGLALLMGSERWDVNTISRHSLVEMIKDRTEEKKKGRIEIKRKKKEGKRNQQEIKKTILGMWKGTKEQGRV